MDLEQSDIFKVKDDKITELTCKVNQLELKLKEKKKIIQNSQNKRL